MNLQHALERMPQKGPMLLIEQVVSADASDIHCIACDHTSADYPLRLDGRLMPVSLVELGAQAAAAHASIIAIGDHHAGLLLALHRVEVTNPGALDSGERLHAHATQLHFDEGGARYSFTVTAGERAILTGQAMLKMEAVTP